MNIKSILENLDREIISEETATAIAEAFETAVQEKSDAIIKLEVESAISKVDEDHAAKLEKLLESIDSDHTDKLEKVVNAITEDHTSKLEMISNYYKKALNEKADEFSNKLVSDVSKFIDIALEKAIPEAQLTEAVTNVYARKKLNQIRDLVSVDSEHINESVKNTISAGKNKVDELVTKLNESYKENESLLEKIKSVEAKSILEEKTKGMSSSKKDFILKLLNDKESSYIQENFNYVVEMFERSEEETANSLVAEAKQKAQSRDAAVPATPKLVTESNNSNNDLRHVSEYLNELKRK